MTALQFAQIEESVAQGLCFEFILHEYARALVLVLQWKKKSRQVISEEMNRLISDPTLGFPSEPGILDRLCFYCTTLLQVSKSGSELVEGVDQLRRTTALLRTDLLVRPVRGSSSRSSVLLLLEKQLRAFFSILSEIFQRRIPCEVALFTLLELRRVFNTHLGERTVEKLLQKLFPGGPDSFRKFLSEGFSKRGFSGFYQRHESLLNELTWKVAARIVQKS